MTEVVYCCWFAFVPWTLACMYRAGFRKLLTAWGCLFLDTGAMTNGHPVRTSNKSERLLATDCWPLGFSPHANIAVVKHFKPPFVMTKLCLEFSNLYVGLKTPHALSSLPPERYVQSGLVKNS